MKGECCLPEILKHPKAGFAETESVIRTGRPADSIRARGVVATPTRCRIYGCSSSFTPNSVSLLHRGADHIWVLAVPKRLRYFLVRDPQRVGAVLGIFLRVIEETLRQASPGAGRGARLGAVSFVHRFGASLNAHLHYHCCRAEQSSAYLAGWKAPSGKG